MDLEFAIKVHSSISPKRIIALLLKSGKAVAFTLRPQNAKRPSLKRTLPGREGKERSKEKRKGFRVTNCYTHPSVCENETYNKLDLIFMGKGSIGYTYR